MAGTKPNILDLIKTNFINSTKTGMWPKLDKLTIINEMYDRCIDPAKISQKSWGCCGVVAVLYWLAKKNPVRYEVICREIFENGEFAGRAGVYSASESVRNRDLPFQDPDLSKCISQVEWMTVATMLDDLRGHDEDVTGDAAGTFPGEVTDWVEDILEYNHVDTDWDYINGEMDTLKKASDYIKRNGIAILQVDSVLIDPSKTNGWLAELIFNAPNHWICLVGDVEIDNGDWYAWDSGSVKFRYFSWGNDQGILQTDEGNLEDNLCYGILAY